MNGTPAGGREEPAGAGGGSGPPPEEPAATTAEQDQDKRFRWAIGVAAVALVVAVAALVGAIVTNDDKASEADVVDAVTELEEAVETAIGGQVETAAELQTAEKQAGKKVRKQQEVSKALDQRVSSLEGKVDQQGKDITSLQGSVEQLTSTVSSLEGSLKTLEKQLRKLAK